MKRTVIVSAVQLAAEIQGRTAAERRTRTLDAMRSGIREAGDRGSDLVLLGEYSNLWHRSVSPRKRDYTPDPVPGPLTRELGNLARRYHMNLVVPLFGKVEGSLSSCAVIFNRDGSIAGTYKKTHPTLPEQRLGIRPGGDLSVYRLDFGVVGVMICMDIEYPEVAQVLMLRGAELLLFPHVQSGWGEPDWEIRFRSRAVDTGLPLVSACYGYPEGAWLPGKMLGRSGVVGRDGLLQSDIGRRIGVVTTPVDLGTGRLTPFFFNTLNPRSLAVAASRRPSLYGALTDRTVVKRALTKIVGSHTTAARHTRKRKRP
jgi:predicted amidohydrolase